MAAEQKRRSYKGRRKPIPTAPPVPLSVCMIVRDEADVLPRVLGALAGRVTEIVVVDTGSVDSTPAIARAAGAVVHQVPWQDDFSLARNAALQAATGAWCLILDADEVVDEKTWPRLYNWLAAPPAPLGRATVRSRTREGLVSESGTRVCPRDPAYHYVGRVHEQLCGPGRRAETGLIIDHSGYTEEALLGKDKIERNLRLLRRDIEEHPGDPYLLYQIGRTLWRLSPQQALNHYEMALRATPDDAPYLAGLVRDLGYALKNTGAAARALELALGYRKRFPGFTDLVFLEGLCYLDLGQAEDMLRAFSRCLALGDAVGYPTVAGVGSFRAHFNVGLFCELSGETAQAIRHYREALEAAPDFRPAAERLRPLLQGQALHKARSSEGQGLGQPPDPPEPPPCARPGGRSGGPPDSSP